jgi:hypothetical protein
MDLNISSSNFIPIQLVNYEKLNCVTNVVHEDDFQYKCLSAVIAQIKLCILDGFTKSSSEFGPTVTQCSKIFLNNIPRFHSLQNKDETKYIWLPADPIKMWSPCSVVSWGVGNDIEAEQALKKIYTECKFFGADPIYESGKVYKEIGEYYQTAVGAKVGNEPASVLENGTYHMSTVKYISMDQFFNMTNLDFVDYLIMDNEGAEYEIIPLMEKSKFNTTICQFNAELHMPLSHHGITESNFTKLFRTFIINSDFMPVMAAGSHIRTTWLNVANRKCIEKYFPNYCKNCENAVKSFTNSKV